jgi:hypothetical protein
MCYRWISNYFLISIWLRATIDAYVNPTNAIINIKKIKSYDTLKRKPNNNRSIAYVPNFNEIPAKITDPGVGASTWASGNQICKGIIGTFTAKPMNIKNQKINWRSVRKCDCKKNSNEDDPLLK